MLGIHLFGVANRENLRTEFVYDSLNFDNKKFIKYHSIIEKMLVTNSSNCLKQEINSILFFSKYFIMQIRSKEG